MFPCDSLAKKVLDLFRCSPGLLRGLQPSNAGDLIQRTIERLAVRASHRIGSATDFLCCLSKAFIYSVGVGPCSGLCHCRPHLTRQRVFGEHADISRKRGVLPHIEAGDLLCLLLGDHLVIGIDQFGLGLHLRLAGRLVDDRLTTLGLYSNHRGIAVCVQHRLANRLAIGVKFRHERLERCDAGIVLKPDRLHELPRFGRVSTMLQIEESLNLGTHFSNRQAALLALANELLHLGEVVDLPQINGSPRRHQILLPGLVLQRTGVVGLLAKTLAIVTEVCLARNTGTPLHPVHVSHPAVHHAKVIRPLANAGANAVKTLDDLVHLVRADGGADPHVTLRRDVLKQSSQVVSTLRRVKRVGSQQPLGLVRQDSLGDKIGMLRPRHAASSLLRLEIIPVLEIHQLVIRTGSPADTLVEERTGVTHRR